MHACADMCILPAMSSIHTADSPMPGLSAARPVRFWSDWFNTEVADFWLAHLPARWRFNRLLARVCERRPAAADAVTLRLRVPRRWTPAVAGQHVEITVEIDGVRNHGRDRWRPPHPQLQPVGTAERCASHRDYRREGRPRQGQRVSVFTLAGG